MKKVFSLAILLIVLVGCHPEDQQPELVNPRSEMLQVLDFTAQLVSHAVTSNQARNEVLGYSFIENDGEVEVSFRDLLSSEPVQKSLVNGAPSGSFAQVFRPLAERWQSDERLTPGASTVNTLSDLENYLKKNNLGLFGPYLSENHANSSEPITVSFDPLDDTKETNYGYRLIPKKQGNASADQNLNQVTNFDNYELEVVQNIDDDYAFNHPLLVIVPIDDDDDDTGNYVTPPSPVYGQSPMPIPSTGIICSDLLEDDLLMPTMARFRLLDNLRGGVWNRNLINMYAITKDDITFDINNNALINSAVAQVWKEYRVSRKNARQKNWIVTNTLLDSNWKLDEDNIFIAFSYKRTKVSIDKVTAEVSGTYGNPAINGKVGVELKFMSKHELLYSFPYDKCATLALYKTPSTNGLEQGLRVQSGSGKLEFTFDMSWYR
ncbi:hypothetical protein [Roseivirga sp.]|uniref:hypothetical protein n=1 Tax=Roseivirga sp. TaxID=1964215 RepID=UPI003B52678C